MSDILAALEGVSFGFPGRELLFKELSCRFSIEEGTSLVIAVMGSSGCGKTTLLRLLAGLEKPCSGTVRVEPGERMGYLQQEPVIFQHLGRMENAKFYTRLKRQRNYFEPDLFARLISTLRLGADLDLAEPVETMSGGAQQRLCLLRALSNRPSVLLLDEPCTGLDPIVRHDFLLSLREALSQATNIVFYASHHPDEALLVGDELLFMTTDRGSGIAEVSVKPMKEALAQPTLEIAQFFSSPYLNILRLTPEVGALLLPSEARHIVITSSGSDAVVTIAFEPAAVRWTCSQGVPVEVVSKSGQHCLVRMTQNGREAQRRIVGPACGSAPSAFVLGGEVLVFSESGGFLDRLLVNGDRGIDAAQFAELHAAR